MLIYKNTHVEALDEQYVEGGEPGRLDAEFASFARTELRERDVPDITQSLEDEGTLVPNSRADYDGFASERNDVDRILKHGYRHALDVAIAQNKPIETFWISSAGSDFEVHVCEGRSAILVFFAFPNEGPTGKFGSTRAVSRSWVFRAGDTEEIHPDAPRETVDSDDPQVLRIGASGTDILGSPAQS